MKFFAVLLLALFQIIGTSWGQEVTAAAPDVETVKIDDKFLMAKAMAGLVESLKGKTSEAGAEKDAKRGSGLRCYFCGPLKGLKTKACTDVIEDTEQMDCDAVQDVCQSVNLGGKLLRSCHRKNIFPPSAPVGPCFADQLGVTTICLCDSNLCNTKAMDSIQITGGTCYRAN